MTAPKDRPPNVVAIGVHLAREGWKWLCDRYEVCGVVSQTSYVDTRLGRVGGTSRGSVAVQRGKVEDAEHLSPEEARALSSALSRAAWMTEQWNKKNAGYYAVRVVRDEVGVRVTHHDKTYAMRLVNGRRLRQCAGCRGMHTVLWTAINPPDRRSYEPNPERDFARVCEACVERLAAAPTGLREVTR